NAYCSGSKVVGSHVIHCAHGRAHGQCDLARTIEQSCNICAGTLAERLGAEAVYRHVRDFGFLERTGVQVPGEKCGWVGDWHNWKPIKTINVGFGQGIVVTPMQMIRAYSAIANDGVLVRPQIVSQEADQQVKSQMVAHRVMTVENARLLRSYM